MFRFKDIKIIKVTILFIFWFHYKNQLLNSTSLNIKMLKTFGKKFRKYYVQLIEKYFIVIDIVS